MLAESATAGFLQGEPYWPAKLVVDLERRSPGRAFEWGAGCMKALLENIETAGKSKLLDWLSSLTDPALSPTAEQAAMQSDRIWREMRDIPHAALSHLYAAQAFRIRGDDRAYRTTLVSAVRILGRHEFYQDAGPALAVSLYKDLAARTVP